MKKTFTINISGTIFHIDEDAYEKLQKYLQMLNRHFGKATEGLEILQDIEARISELFVEKTANKVEVISDAMVDEIITRMGKPEDFMEPADDDPTGTKTTDVPYGSPDRPIRRRLYRDGESRVLGGVCSGLGAYFNIDTVILRIVFVLAFFLGVGASLLVYIILWIVVPKAKTTAQRLEMRGMEATVSNIEKSFKEEVNEVGETINRFKNADGSDKGISRMDRFGDMLGSMLRLAVRILILVFGAALIVGGIASLIGFVTSLAFGHSFLHGGMWPYGWDSDINMTSLLNNFISPGAYTISLISLSILIGIPILLIVFAGTKLVFRYKTNNKMIGLGALGLWLLSLIVLIVVGVNQAGNFAKQSSQTISQKIENTQIKNLNLELADDLYESLVDEHISLERMKVAKVNGQEKLLGNPRFTIEKSPTDEFLLQIKKRARGKSSEEAQENVAQIDYKYVQKDSTIVFDPYYFLQDGAKWRNQEVSMVLKVPEGKSVYLSKKMVTIIYDIENVNNMWDGDMVGKTWIMTPEGLKQKESVVSIAK